MIPSSYKWGNNRHNCGLDQMIQAYKFIYETRYSQSHPKGGEKSTGFARSQYFPTIYRYSGAAIIEKINVYYSVLFQWQSRQNFKLIRKIYWNRKKQQKRVILLYIIVVAPEPLQFHQKQQILPTIYRDRETLKVGTRQEIWTSFDN